LGGNKKSGSYSRWSAQIETKRVQKPNADTHHATSTEPINHSNTSDDRQGDYGAVVAAFEPISADCSIGAVAPSIDQSISKTASIDNSDEVYLQGENNKLNQFDFGLRMVRAGT
jgi:hypothetical protein